MKPFKRFQKFDDMSFTNHFFEGFVWPVESKRTGETYDVTLTNKGFNCTCMGLSMHGKCKHIKEVHDNLVAPELLPVDLFA